MIGRSLPTIVDINPVDAENFTDWATSPEGQTLLDSVLSRVQDFEQESPHVSRREKPGPLPGSPGKPFAARPWQTRERRHSRVGIGLVAAGVVVVAALVAWGAYTLFSELGRSQPVIVITDDSMGASSDPSSSGALANVFPPGISRVVGKTDSSIWCLSRQDGLVTLKADVDRVTVGERADLVAYTTRHEPGVIYLWNTGKTDDGAVSELQVGDPSHMVSEFLMSPDETKLFVIRLEVTDPSTDGGVLHAYVVDLQTRHARDWHWPQKAETPWTETGDIPYGWVTKLLWSRSSDAIYVSFGPMGGSDGEVSYRFDIATDEFTPLKGIAAVRDANADGEVVGLTGGPAIMFEGAGSADVGSLPVAAWTAGQLETLPHALGFRLWDGAWISPGGMFVVVHGRITSTDGSSSGALEVNGRGYGPAWPTPRVVSFPDREISQGLGFLGDNTFYFAARLAGEELPGRLTYLGTWDPIAGESRVYDALPVPEYSWVIGIAARSEESSSSATSTTTPTLPEALDALGFWSGNVQTVPEHPVSLPPEFYEEPEDPAQLAMGEPLWVFAGELSPEEAATAVKNASEDQTVLVFALSDELAGLLGIPRYQINRLTSEEGLSPLFPQTPMATREKVFAEEGPFWQVVWGDLGGDGSASFRVDPEKVYQTGALFTMQLEDQRRGLEENRQRQAAGLAPDETATTDPYPIPQTVESAEAEALADKVADYVFTLTGQRLQADQAVESQMIGAGGVLEHRAHNGHLVLAGPDKWLGYSVFWSDEDQIDHAMPNGPGDGLPSYWFDAGEGSKGYITAQYGYYCRLQLANGITAYVSTGGPTNQRQLPTPEASVLTAEQMITLTKWLAGQAEYLHP